MIVPQFIKSAQFERLPYSLIGGGVALSGVMIAEVMATSISSIEFTTVQLLNFVATVPFLVFLIGGGYLLIQGDIEISRYSRIAGWTVSGLTFLTGFFTIISISHDGVFVQIQLIRWAATAGAGTGALIGIFEARAIHRAVANERTQIRNRELERQNDRLEKFANILSHDLRNPLQVATGTLEILQERYDDEHLDRVESAHERIEEIIEETLLLAESGQSIDSTESVSLADFVDRCRTTVDLESVNLEVENSAAIVVDVSRLQRLLENVFRNAVEHAGSGVTVRVGTLPNGFYVEDDGPGIPPEDRDAVAESGYSTKENGTGFGLAFVAEIAEAHGWNMQITEGSDGGARFEFTGVKFADE